MRIFFVGCLPPHRGGAAMSSQLLLEGLADAGCEVHALALGYPKQPSPRGRHEDPRGVEVTRQPIQTTEESPGDDPRLACRVAEAEVAGPVVERIVAAQRSQLILIGAEAAVHYIAPIARANNIPSMLRVTGSYAHRIVCGQQSPEIALDWLEKLRDVDRVVCLTEAMRRGLEQLGVRNLRLATNAVDLERFRPTAPDCTLRDRWGIPPDARVLLHASGMKQVKRPLDIIQAFAAVAEQDERFRFLVVGDGPQRKHVEAEAARLGLSDRTWFPGWVENNEMPRYYSLADAVIMASEREGLSRVYLEAQACGTVLIASDIPAARAVVEHGRTGLLFPVGDTQHLASTILEAMADDRRREAIEATALEQVRAHHDLRRLTRLYLEMISELVSGR